MMNNLKWCDRNSGFKNRLCCGKIINSNNIIDPFVFLNECESVLKQTVGKKIIDFKCAIKMNCSLCCQYIIKKNNEEILSEVHHASKMKPLNISDDFNAWFNGNVFDSIKKKLDEFQERDSGKSLNKILYLDINIASYNCLNSNGGTYIKLPKDIENKKAIINVFNKDEKCFIWSILAAIFPVSKNPQRVTSYPQNIEDIFNLNKIRFPTPLSDIKIFESQNADISINVFGLEYNIKNKRNEIIGPLYATKNKKDVHVNLLYFTNEFSSHYVYIKSLSRLIGSQVSRNSNQIWVCDRCLQYFSSVVILKRHEEDCVQVSKAVRVDLPTEEQKWMRFKNFSHKERHPFVIYADIESLTVPIHTTSPNPESSFTNAYQHHVPCAIAYKVVCGYNDSYSWYESFTGPDCIKWFLNRLEHVVNVVSTLYKNIEPMQMTEEEWKLYDEAETCHICNKPFEDLDTRKKVRNHSHLSGKFRGAAHVDCNLNYKEPNFIPVYFHNLSGYDGHYLVKELGLDENLLKVIPNNSEKFISFSKKISKMWIRFIDTYRFLNSSLEKLSLSLKHDSFKYLKKYYPKPEEFNLLVQKGIFPYDFLNSWAKLNETELPGIEHFYSKLRNENITTAEYLHAKKVWTTFKHKSLQEYMETYLHSDVLLLTDIFENFRTVCIESYKLDPAYYYTTPGLSWDAMLKMTDIKLELLSDIDMVLFFERSIRGGISQVCNRYSKANNHYMNNYNPEDQEKYIMYFDACNLYGWAMKNYLPTDGFEWITDAQEIKNFDVTSIPDNSAVGFMLEVDLEYPENLHDIHKDLPMCCEQRIPNSSKIKKLMTTLHNKEKYIIHYRNLKQCLNLGLKLTKIHRIIKFNQSPWIENYIDTNTNFRKQAKCEFEKNLFKLLNNAIYGKSIESIRKRRNIKLVNKWDGRNGVRKLITKPNFCRFDLIDENLAIVELNKTSIFFNKPIYIGACILEISKWLMYEFHYNYIHKIYVNPKLLYMDTDSFIYEFTSQDPYKQILIDLHRFDTSDYEPNNIYNIPQANKKVVGLFKDENCGKIITEFVGLRAKMYNFSLENEQQNSSHARAKGVSHIVTKTLTMDDYKNTLFFQENKFRKQNRITSKSHNIFSVETNKLSLSANDDKRHLLEGSTDTLPLGHYKIKQ